MTRKKRDFSRPTLPDPKYKDFVLAKTISIVMKHGKKSVAEKAIYKALDRVQEKVGKKGLDAFHEALANIKPYVEVRSRRVGGATYQVPTEVRPARSQALAIRWLVKGANSRNERTLWERMAGEIMDALGNRGSAVKKREDTHKMADANKAFAHFRW